MEYFQLILGLIISEKYLNQIKLHHFHAMN